MSHANFVRAKRNELIDVANAMMGGQIHLLDGVRKICLLRHASEEPNNKVFRTFRAIDSETDHFPLGETRLNYDKATLAKLDQELGAYIADAKEDILEACKDLIREFAH